MALIGNSLDNTMTLIDTAAPVTVTATIACPASQWQDRDQPGTAGSLCGRAGHRRLFGADGPRHEPFAQIVDIPLSVFEPIGVAVNPAGTRAYVTGGLTDNIVSVVNLDTRLEIATITLHPTDAVGPYGIIVHPSQPRLYVANSNSGTISVINTANNAIVTTITLTPCPNGCAPNKMVVRPTAAGSMSPTTSPTWCGSSTPRTTRS